jgi:membrane-associated phospholipid phosphatase
MTDTPISPAYLPYVLFALAWAVLFLIVLVLPVVGKGLCRLAPRVMKRPYLRRAWERGRARMGTLQAYLPTIAILVIGIGATLFIGEDFVELAVLLRQQSPTMLDIDQSVYRWAASMRSDASTTFFLTFTRIGSPIGLAVLATGIAALLYVRRHRGLALYLMVSACMGALLNLTLKEIFRRARPDLAEALRQAHGYSFPSGHAMGSMIVFGAMAYVVSRLGGRWRLRAATIAFLIASILSVGLSRVYLGVHWISDIGAGYIAGLTWLIAATVTFEAFWRIRRIRARQKGNPISK